MVSQKEIAERCGCSKATVSLALRGSPKISEQKKQEILSVARELGYSLDENLSRTLSDVRLSRSFPEKKRIAYISPNDAEKNIVLEHIKSVSSDYRIIIEEFRLDQIELSKLSQIISYRGFSGVILGYVKDHPISLKAFSEAFSSIPKVLYGIPHLSEDIHCCCADHFSNALIVSEKVARNSYSNPLFFYPEKGVNPLVLLRTIAGLEVYLKSLGFNLDNIFVYKSLSHLEGYVRKMNPDCLIGFESMMNSSVLKFARSENFINLDIRDLEAGDQGILQNMDAIAESGLNILMNAIKAKVEPKSKLSQRANINRIFVMGKWIDSKED